MPNNVDSVLWKKILPVEDIPVMGARVLQAEVGPIAIFRNAQDEVFAILDECPHKGGPLSQGIVHGKSVTCPLHAWNIDLSTGCALEPDVGCAKSFMLKVDAGNVYLNLEEIKAPHA